MATNIMAVANISKGFKYNDQTKAYDVNIDSNGSSGLEIDSSGNVGVKLSPDSGNLLEKRSTGLYYGIQAPADLANLYIDAVEGVDQDPDKVTGAGTRAKPLRTLKYALSLGNQGINRNIHLRENQTHYVDYPTYIRGGKVIFENYGEIRDTLGASQYTGYGNYSNDSYMPLHAKIGIRPSDWRIVFSEIFDSYSFNGNPILIDQDTNVVFNGIDVYLPANKKIIEELKATPQWNGKTAHTTYMGLFSVNDATFTLRLNACDVYTESYSTKGDLSGGDENFSTFIADGDGAVINFSFQVYGISGDEGSFIVQAHTGDTLTIANDPHPTKRSSPYKAIGAGNAKQLIRGVVANQYAYRNIVSNLDPAWFA